MDRYATLRHGLIGAWCPSLGDSGYLLRSRVPGLPNASFNAGCSLVARPGGVAVLPNGSSGRVDLGVSFTPHTTITVAYWFLRTSTAGGIGVQHGDGETNRTFFAGGIDNVVYVGQRNPSGVPLVSFSLSSFSLNTWHHFVGQITTGGSFQRIWINGVQRIATSSGTINSFPSVNANADIGERFTGSNSEWRSSAHDDVRIYNRALTQSEIVLLASQRGIGLLPTRHRRANVLGSQFWLRDAGTWKKATGWIKVNGVWTKATPKIRVSGAYK